MSEASIPVDLFNPGQVFACLGFLEAADVLLGDAEGRFDWSDDAHVVFAIQTSQDVDPVSTVLGFLTSASLCALSPSEQFCERDGGTTQFVPDVHPCRFEDEKGKPRTALLPIRLAYQDKLIDFAYWCDFDSGRPTLRLWTPTNGNSAFVRFSKLLKSFRDTVTSGSSSDPFNVSSVVAANFRLELRRNWTALNLGFSPDKIGKNGKCIPVDINTYPVVEILAALGLSNARPRQVPNDYLHWTYAVWGDSLPVELARPAVSQKLLHPGAREFRMELEEPNDGGDLSIANAVEEITRE